MPTDGTPITTVSVRDKGRNESHNAETSTKWKTCRQSLSNRVQESAEPHIHPENRTQAWRNRSTVLFCFVFLQLTEKGRRPGVNTLSPGQSKMRKTLPRGNKKLKPAPSEERIQAMEMDGSLGQSHTQPLSLYLLLPLASHSLFPCLFLYPSVCLSIPFLFISLLCPVLICFFLFFCLTIPPSLALSYGYTMSFFLFTS